MWLGIENVEQFCNRIYRRHQSQSGSGSGSGSGSVRLFGVQMTPGYIEWHD